MGQGPLAISFTGGLGAQIISAAAYFHWMHQGVEVYANMDYFDRPYHVATPGVAGDMSHWKWALDGFGLTVQDFRCNSDPQIPTVWDGWDKVRAGFLGLSEAVVAARFPIPEASVEYKTGLFGAQPFACVHLRRGDYLNVASYVVDDDALFGALKKVSRLIDNVLVVSDTSLSDRMNGLIGSLGKNAVVAIGGDAHLVHGLMRSSDILICSNSQFSTTAAALRRDDQLTLIPARHDAMPSSEGNRFLDGVRQFQLFSAIDIGCLR